MAFEPHRNPRKTGILIGVLILVLVILGGCGYYLVTEWIVPGQKYAAAQTLYNSGSYAEAEAAFAELGSYRDASDRVLACRDGLGMFYVDSKDYDSLNAHIRSCGLSTALQEYILGTALRAVDQGDYAAARSLIPALSDAPDAQDGIREALYQQGLVHYARGEYAISDELFAFLGAYKDSAEKIHVHEYVLTAVTVPACEEAGAEEYLCHCGETDVKPIPATGHAYSEASCTQPATCSVCAAISGTTLPHDYAPATCYKAKTCSVCGQTDGAALGHSMVNCVCSRCGKVKISLSQLQGTWIHSAGFYTMTVSGSTATVRWITGDIEFTGEVQLRDYGFFVKGTYDYVTIDGVPCTGIIKLSCYISKFTSTYFVDVFDDFGPYRWYKQ